VGVQPNLPGITALVAAAALFSLMDAGMKLLSPFYPAMQVTALRSLASWPFVLIWVASTTGLRSPS